MQNQNRNHNRSRNRRLRSNRQQRMDYECVDCQFIWTVYDIRQNEQVFCPECDGQAFQYHYEQNLEQLPIPRTSTKLPRGTKERNIVNDPQKNHRYYAIFHCEFCSEEWENSNSYFGEEQECENCSAKILPDKFYSLFRNEPLYSGLVENPVLEKRYFGYFWCHECNYRWHNNDVFLNVPQRCDRCEEKTLAESFFIRRNIKAFVRNPKIGKKYFGDFQCGKCLKLWKSSSAFINYKQSCKRCGMKGIESWDFPYGLSYADDNDDGEVYFPIDEKKYFGLVKCLNCHSKRKRKNCEPQKKEDCKRCESEMFVHRFFDFKREKKLGISSKHHEKELCEKCQTDQPCKFYEDE